MFLPRLLTVRTLLLWMHPRGKKRLGYPPLLHPEDEEGQRLFLPRLLLPIIDTVLRHTTALFRGPGIDSANDGVVNMFAGISRTEQRNDREGSNSNTQE